FLVGQKFRHGFPVHAGGLHACMRIGGAMLVEPLDQCGKTALFIFKYLVFVLAIRQAQRAVQLGFGDINTQIKRLHATSSCDLPCECGLPASRAKDTVRSLTEGEWLLQTSSPRARGQRLGTAYNHSFSKCPSRTVVRYRSPLCAGGGSNRATRSFRRPRRTT